MAIAPLPYIYGSQKMGHFAIGQRSGALSGISAGDVLARLRWPSPSGYGVLLRLDAWIAFSAQATTPVEMALKATIARSFKTDFTTNVTSADLSAQTKSGIMRGDSMGQSLMANSGPGIATTGGMTGGVYVADSDPFAIVPVRTLVPVPAPTSNSLSLPIGVVSDQITLYQWEDLGEHPPVLSANEGILLQSALNGPADGAWRLYVRWKWAEMPVF